MRRSLTLCLFAAIAASSALAGDPKEVITIEDPRPFYDTKRPISNPVLFDLAVPRTKVHALFLHQTMPDQIDTTLGTLPLGGEIQVYAVQAEFAVNPRFSLVASKDGYIDFSPNNTFNDTSGWANIAAGAKYAWLYNPETMTVSSIQLVYEIPSGDSDVWQGNGDGVLIPTLLTQKTLGKLQLASGLGVKLPLDDDAESTISFSSVHAGYQLTDWLYPLVEFNWFHVLEAGDGASRFGAQAGGITPGIARFEAGDLVNWGASNSSDNNDLVTMAIGFRATCPNLDFMDFGFAWEFPLSADEASLMEDRFTFDVEIKLPK